MGFRSPPKNTAKRAMSEWDGTQIRHATKTDVGLVRENNQDNLLANPSIGLFLVADGMGGRAGGEVASRLAAETIGSEVGLRHHDLLRSDQITREILLKQSINLASLAVYSRSLEMPYLRGMGTTATVLWLPAAEVPKNNHSAPSKALIAHVGDSRCYLLRAGLLYQLTNDHSLFQEKLKAGLISPDSPNAMQMKSVITRCVGYQEDEEVDVFSFQPFRGDRFLLCSDGLSNKIEDSEIAELMLEDDIEWVCEHLVELAKERGGDDNITVIIAALESERT